MNLNMSYISDYGLDSPARGLTLLVLSIEDKKKRKLMDTIHIHKTIRYFLALTGKKNVGYSNYKLGGVSFEIEDTLDILQENGLIDQLDNGYIPTAEGELVVKRGLKDFYGNDVFEKLSFAKRRLNELISNELMYFMYNMLPETKENSTEFLRLEKDRDKLIRNLFLKGTIDIENYRFFGITDKQFNESMAIANDSEFIDAIEKGSKDIQQGNMRPLSELLRKHKVYCT